MAMSFSDYLSACMQAAGYPTPASLSRATGISEGVLSRWLNGGLDAKPPRTYMLRKLVPALHVPLLELVVAAKIMTAEEARLPEEPRPPKPLGDEEIERMIESTSASDDTKNQLRSEIARLRQLAFEEQRRAPSRASRRMPESDREQERRGA